MAFARILTEGNPCTPDCAEREPGCNCQKRKDWIAVKDQRKAEVRKKKQMENVIDETMFGKGRVKFPRR